MKKIIVLVVFFSLMPHLNAQQLQTPEMEPIGYQIGKWLAVDIQTGQGGRRFQFAFSLAWFDRNQSIAKMNIFGVYEDGEVRQYWEGFKNWDPVENKILYVGMSLDGRAARGHVEQVSNGVFKTVYSGMFNGKKVFIEDVATKHSNESYTTETHLRMEGQTESRIVNTDHWVKVDSQKFNDKLKSKKG